MPYQIMTSQFINYSDIHGKSALHYAAQKESLENI
jgi:hypothetical protein